MEMQSVYNKALLGTASDPQHSTSAKHGGMCSSLLVFIDDVTTDRSTMNSEVSAGKVICVHLDVYNRSEI